MDTKTGSSTLTGPKRERDCNIYPMFEKSSKQRAGSQGKK